QFRRRIGNLSNRDILFLLVIIAAGSSFASLINSEGFSREWRSGWYQNFSTEIVGAVLTFLLFDMLIQTREQKEHTIRDLSSCINHTARRAAEELHARGWLQDGSLRSMDLTDADLRGARMSDADLQRANLWRANLNRVQFIKANLTGANLTDALLHEANLDGACLHEAQLIRADLQEVLLFQTDMCGANLRDANLSRAQHIEYVRFDEHTILPDESLWTADADLMRFTDPAHPDFWRSDNPISPAYQDDMEHV
ncbi:MAG TPA: pentapeptide repeat-containing protein, partial [Aggregatilineales bacterium]|nr:pentapeptide repeat-containing protein [Aggregatilineales bacterium]